MQLLLDLEYIATIYFSLTIFLFVLPKRKFYYIYLIVSFVLVELCRYYKFLPPDPFSYLTIYLVMIGVVYLIFDTDIIGVLFIVTLTFSVQHISYKATMILITLINYNLRGEHPYLIFLFSFIALFNTGIYFNFLRRYRKEHELTINNYYLLIVSILILVLSIVVSYYVEDPILETKNYVLYSLVNVYAILGSVAGIAILFLSSNKTKLEHENKILELILKNDEKRYELAKITHEQINIKYHDLKHYLSENKVNKDDIIEIEKEGKIFKCIYYTGNKVLDIVLLEKSLNCLNNDISFLTMADGNLLNFISSNHIYSMFSNLLDNAIESTMKFEEKDRRIIRLNISKQRENVLIVLENSCKNPPIFKNGELVSSKIDKENHGFGTKSIKNIVEKYNGNYYVDYTDNKFTTKIIFPLGDADILLDSF